MYLKKSVEKFLVDENIEKDIIEPIQKRMSEISGTGMFLSNQLEYVMGNTKLVQKYIHACENDIDLLLFGNPN